MRVTPELIDTVAFLCAQNRLGKNVPGATAFFVELRDEADPKRIWTYLVTAEHCLNEIKGQDVYVRINTVPSVSASTGYEDIKTRKDDWFRHWNADVAAILAPYDPERHAIQRIPSELFITDDYRLDVGSFDGRGNPVLEPVLRGNYPNGIKVELGNELFFVGLYVQSAGKNRNLPIARFGHISRMPGQELVTIEGAASGKKQIRAYLAEVHSWGGHSGSPVFWHYEYNISLPLDARRWQPPQSPLLGPQKRRDSERIDVQVGRGWVEGLLGLVSAHFDNEISPKQGQQSSDAVIAALNAGTAVITPAANIMELLRSDEMKEDRRNRLAAMKDDEPTATADFAKAKNKTRDVVIPPIKRGRFFSDLTKATRRRGK